jgi:hypothetical protein
VFWGIGDDVPTEISIDTRAFTEIIRKAAAPRIELLGNRPSTAPQPYRGMVTQARRDGPGPRIEDHGGSDRTVDWF